MEQGEKSFPHCPPASNPARQHTHTEQGEYLFFRVLVQFSSISFIFQSDVSDGGDLSLHQQEVTGGQLVTMSLVPSPGDSDVAPECHLCCPPLYLRGRCPPWTSAEDSVP